LGSHVAEKIKESAISVVPVMLIVVLLNFALSLYQGGPAAMLALSGAPLSYSLLTQFIIGGALLILGLGIFLIGADLGMVPFGHMVGSALTKKINLPLILGASFAIGFAITIAEPDVQVLANQVVGAAPSINRGMLLFMIAAGVGFFLIVAMLRVVMRLPLKWLLIGFYLLVFIVCSHIDPAFVGIAFDSGGATTGPVTVPFIMAMGIGVASAVKTREGDDNNFGFVGLASIGPIAAVALMGLLFSARVGGEMADSAAGEGLSVLGVFINTVPHVVVEIFLALAPLLVIFFIFNFFLLHLPKEQMRRMMFGMAYAFIGLVMFMTGVSGGFIPAGQALGMALGGMGQGWILLPVGLLLGAVVVCAEPAVWVLTDQVEEVSGGSIRRSIMLAALSISIALAVGLGMFRVITGLSIWYALIPGYALALGLTFFTPPLFTAIAFDSGGVASGPMSTTFVLSLTLGASMATGGNPATDAFGIVAMIAMAPLITIQVLGLIYKYLENKALRAEQSRGRQCG
jgi:hypothetical protein